MIIVVEGGEGAGKSTLVKLLRNDLEAARIAELLQDDSEYTGRGVVEAMRFPSDYIRSEFLSKDLAPHDAQAMMFADFGIHYEHILYASEWENILILDRSWISNVVYTTPGLTDLLHNTDEVVTRINKIRSHIDHGMNMFMRTFPKILERRILYVFLDVDVDTGLSREIGAGKFSDPKTAQDIIHLYRFTFDVDCVNILKSTKHQICRFWTGKRSPDHPSTWSAEDISKKVVKLALDRYNLG